MPQSRYCLKSVDKSQSVYSISNSDQWYQQMNTAFPAYNLLQGFRDPDKENRVH